MSIQFLQVHYEGSLLPGEGKVESGEWPRGCCGAGAAQGLGWKLLHCQQGSKTGSKAAKQSSLQSWHQLHLPGAVQSLPRLTGRAADFSVLKHHSNKALEKYQQGQSPGTGRGTGQERAGGGEQLAVQSGSVVVNCWVGVRKICEGESKSMAAWNE